ncbi:DUF6517 family protein [Halorarius litoreus]|uniref:DUF6517 family protein n=1 Tax=Halorarius litoreus TaxID=2962676 RepID=UPI0020CEA17A|nr:DUF6517 family protein [Halorarius litoreus]
MSRRRGVLAVALVGLLLTSGCIGFLTGSEALQFSADPAKVTDSAQQETNYEQARSEPQTVTRNFTAAGQTRQVEVTNQLSEYSRSVNLPVFGDQQVARFTVLSTPKVEVAGQGPFNPVDDLNNTELVLTLQQKYEAIDNVQPESERTVTVYGNETTVSKFRADAMTDTGQSVEVFIHITKVEHGDDFLVAVAVYPTQVDGEQENVDVLIRNIEHPAGGE